MNHSTTRISPAKMNNLAESQQKVEEVCQMYFMKLRSGLIIGNRTCYFRRKTIKRHPPKPARKYDKQHLVFTPYQQAPERSSENVASDAQPHNRRSCSEDSYSLSTYNDQSVTFAFADGGYEIYVEDLGKKQEKGDVVDGERLMVSLSPSKDKDFLLHANNQEHSVELQKCENPLPDQTFFFLHTEPGSSTYVSFECKSNPGVFIGVKDNQLALIQLKDQTEHSRRENIKFKLS